MMSNPEKDGDEILTVEEVARLLEEPIKDRLVLFLLNAASDDTGNELNKNFLGES